MTYKSIFVPAISKKTFGPTLEAALIFARKFESHIVACQVRQPFEEYIQPLPYPLELNSLSQARDIHEKAMDALIRNLRSQFESITRDYDCEEVSLNGQPVTPSSSASWMLRTGDPLDILNRYGRMTDIVFMQPTAYPPQSQETELCRQAVTEIGRPICLIPEIGLKEFPAKAVIGWNGSLEATRALASSLPLLKKVNSVTLLVAGELPPNSPDTESVARYLKFHGVEADVETIERSKSSIAIQIAERLDDGDGNIFVMGGYSHSRVRERVFGGVTHELIRAPTSPIFIAH